MKDPSRIIHSKIALLSRERVWMFVANDSLNVGLRVISITAEDYMNLRI